LDCGVIDFSEPCLAPENQTRFLTTIMSDAGTADAFERHDVISVEPERRARFVDAHRQSAPADPKSLPAKLEHLRHERQVIQCSRCVQRLEDFVWRLHFYEITTAKSRVLLTHVIPSTLRLRRI
jgi:hypothetical protein